MEISTREEGDVTIITVNGNLLGDSSNRLMNELMKCVSNKKRKLLINLSGTSQMDSYSIGVLASTGSELEKIGGTLKFAELQPFIENIFEMMRMKSIFEIYDTESEALESFS